MSGSVKKVKITLDRQAPSQWEFDRYCVDVQVTRDGTARSWIYLFMENGTAPKQRHNDIYQNPPRHIYCLVRECCPFNEHWPCT